MYHPKFSPILSSNPNSSSPAPRCCSFEFNTNQIMSARPSANPLQPHATRQATDYNPSARHISFELKRLTCMIVSVLSVASVLIMEGGVKQERWFIFFLVLAKVPRSIEWHDRRLLWNPYFFSNVLLSQRRTARSWDNDLSY